MVDSLLHHPDVDLSSVTVAAMLLRKSIGSTSSGLDHTQSLIVLIVLFPAQLLTTAWVHRKKSEVGAKKPFSSATRTLPPCSAMPKTPNLARVIAKYRPVSTREARDPEDQ
jgi:hypothetical protein